MAENLFGHWTALPDLEVGFGNLHLGLLRDVVMTLKTRSLSLHLLVFLLLLFLCAHGSWCLAFLDLLSLFFQYPKIFHCET